MSNLEHYFENYLFHGEDVTGDLNKNKLSKEEQLAVEICANYVLYTLFYGREDFNEFLAEREELLTKEYNCPDCQRTDGCEGCPRISDSIKVNSQPYLPDRIIWNWGNLLFIPECCRNCSNHPSNGGSGICFCSLPYMTTTDPKRNWYITTYNTVSKEK